VPSQPALRAVVLNCTLKPSPGTSNTEALAEVLVDALESHEVATEQVRVVDLDVHPGISSDAGDGDEWPSIRAMVVASNILVMASPTWLGQPSSVAKRALERLMAMLGEQDEEGRPIAYNRVAGFVVSGNEDGAHHVISEMAGALMDIGFTVPGQAWTYWNRGPGPGPSYLEDEEGRDWSHATARAAASNLAAVARALHEQPIPPPPP